MLLQRLKQKGICVDSESSQVLVFPGLTLLFICAMHLPQLFLRLSLLHVLRSCVLGPRHAGPLLSDRVQAVRPLLGDLTEESSQEGLGDFFSTGSLLWCCGFTIMAPSGYPPPRAPWKTRKPFLSLLSSLLAGYRLTLLSVSGCC